MLVLHLKLSALGVLVGLLGGAVGAAFAHTLSLSTSFRESAPWLILLLPLGAVATVVLYRVFDMSDHGGTNEIIHGVINQSKIRSIAAPLIFVSTAITHLFGGSAGREGAAIQLGGAGAAAVSDVLKLKDDERSVFILSGMSALFSGVFGTPLTATFFILEFKSNKRILPLSIIPCFVSAFAAKNVSSLLGVEEEAFILNNAVSFTLPILGKILLLSACLALLGYAMCFIFDKSQAIAKKLLANATIRAIICSAIIIALTICVGDMRYNNSGMEMALAAVNGEANWFDFILKIVFTAITLSAGFKGGKIVPTFCIGATFGCIFGSIIGLDVSLAAALGIIGLFCCAANSPIGAICLGIEMFGFSALPYFIIIAIVLWLLSVNKGLFDERFFKSPILSKIKIKAK